MTDHTALLRDLDKTAAMMKRNADDYQEWQLDEIERAAAAIRDLEAQSKKDAADGIKQQYNWCKAERRELRERLKIAEAERGSLLIDCTEMSEQVTKMTAERDEARAAVERLLDACERAKAMLEQPARPGAAWNILSAALNPTQEGEEITSNTPENIEKRAKNTPEEINTPCRHCGGYCSRWVNWNEEGYYCPVLDHPEAQPCPECRGWPKLYEGNNGKKCPTCKGTGKKPPCKLCGDSGWQGGPSKLGPWSPWGYLPAQRYMRSCPNGCPVPDSGEDGQ